MAQPDPTAPLCVTFRLTATDYRSGVFRLSWGLWPFKVFVGAAFVGVIGGVVAALLTYWPLAIGLLLVGLGYAATLAWVLFIRPGQQYHRLADAQGEQTYCFSESDISWTFLSGASKVKWSYFVDLLETRDLFVLRHPLKRLGSIVPRRSFVAPDAEARFRQLAQQIGRKPARSQT